MANFFSIKDLRSTSGLLRRAANYFYFSSCRLKTRIMGPKTMVLDRRIFGSELGASPNVVIFAHHSSNASVSEYVFFHLQCLRDLGNTIIFTSNSQELSEEYIGRLGAICDRVLIRRNVGFDLGAYKDAIQEVPDLTLLDRLILTNDSVFGPTQPLQPLLERADPVEADIWGMTDSLQSGYHLQSYFLVIHKRALANPVFVEFWRSLVYTNSKPHIIYHGEIGLSRAMVQSGFRLKALFPYQSMASEVLQKISDKIACEPRWMDDLPHRDFLVRVHNDLVYGVPMNPTHSFWDHLLLTHGFPYLKRQLLVTNPSKIPLTTCWPRVLQEISGYDVEIISRHLQEVSN
jgi:lipopolysaccharide biosynthesis protein